MFTQIGQVAFTTALRTEEAGRATAYSYMQVLFGGVLGVIVFGEVPTLTTLLGAALILGSAILNLHGQKVAAA